MNMQKKPVIRIVKNRDVVGYLYKYNLREFGFETSWQVSDSVMDLCYRIIFLKKEYSIPTKKSK